ncbi:MAG: ECF transporter S component [Clostridia bacterium]|nr:ECF transporter S component [Clostridia bacterium]
MKRSKLTHLVIAALLAALVLVITRLSFPIGAGGYIHVGDSMIYLAVLMLPLPYALPAAMLGAGLADFTSGYAVYVIPTVLIKAAMVLAAKGLIRLPKKAILQDLLICATGVITVAGYYLADVVLALLSGSGTAAAFSAPVAYIPFNTIQAVASGALYLLLARGARNIRWAAD